MLCAGLDDDEGGEVDGDELYGDGGAGGFERCDKRFGGCGGAACEDDLGGVVSGEEDYGLSAKAGGSYGLVNRIFAVEEDDCEF